VRETLAIAAAGVSTAALWILFSPIPKLREAPLDGKRQAGED
jgi:hypothetical protein